jgi:hypothetical protein
MNIIKLKDKLMPDGCKEAPFFNKFLKGKYAYWIHMRYIVPFDTMPYNAYVACEEDINKLLKLEDGSYPRPYGCEYMDLYSHIINLYDNTELQIIDYIDVDVTDKINDIGEYVLKNTYVTDSDITLNEIRNFRTWLAKELLLFDTNYETGEIKNIIFDNLESHVLKYYSNNMIDSTITSLLNFGNINITYNTNTPTHTCGCAGSTDLSSLYNNSVSVCDPINIYKKNIYNKMVEMFSDIKFWEQFPPEFILTFKHYIDNILKTNLPLQKNQYVSSFVDCSCVIDQTQSDGIAILNKLSQALQYIHDGAVSNHRNYIHDALYNWASILYENMDWG